jgi:hypothetical protein
MRQVTTSYRHGKLEEQVSQCFIALGSEPWNFGGERVGFDATAHRNAVAVVLACGLDPDTATRQEMNEKDYWLECLECSERGYNLGGQKVMNWQSTVRSALRTTAHISSVPRRHRWIIVASLT